MQLLRALAMHQSAGWSRSWSNEYRTGVMPLQRFHYRGSASMLHAPSYNLSAGNVNPNAKAAPRCRSEPSERCYREGGCYLGGACDFSRLEPQAVPAIRRQSGGLGNLAGSEGCGGG